MSIERIPHGSWVRVVGTFRYVDMTVHTRPDGVRVMGMGFGWMNSYDRAITRITDFVVLIARASNQSMKLTPKVFASRLASLRGNVNALATGPARGLSLFR